MYSGISTYLEKAIKDEIKKTATYRRLSRVRFLDIRIVDSLSCVRNIQVIVQHRTLDNGCNCSIFSILSYPDWLVSSADFIGYARYKDGKLLYLGEDYGDFTKEKLMEWMFKVQVELNRSVS